MTNSSSSNNPAARAQRLVQLQQRIDYQFTEVGLLEQALKHRSAVRDSAGGQRLHNERLEFLGDAVLGMVVAGHLFAQLADAPESEMTLKRATLVRRETLAEIAREIHLGRYLQLGGGERRAGIGNNDSVLSDALEALIGAVYLDGGMDQSAALVSRLMGARFESLAELETKDAKTRLQEWMQGQRLPLPEYEIVATSGALHAQTFTVECRLPSLAKSGKGSGGSRREAEKAAAAGLLMELRVHD
ncbi:MAG: ribonuclease III [Pseudomonadales bacterium]